MFPSKSYIHRVFKKSILSRFNVPSTRNATFLYKDKDSEVLLKVNKVVKSALFSTRTVITHGNGVPYPEKNKGALCLENLATQPVVIGGCNLDCSFRLEDSRLHMDGRIHDGKFCLSAGGVGRNIAEALYKLNCQPIFLSAIGEDQQATVLKTLMPEGIQNHIKILKNNRTAVCFIFFDCNGNCGFLLGDLGIHEEIDSVMIEENSELIESAAIIILDANLPVKTISSVLKLAATHSVPVLFEPTDLAISSKPFRTPYWRSIKFITPNLNEARFIANHLEIPLGNTAFLNEIHQGAHIGRKLAEYIDNVIITLGPSGLIVARRGKADQPFLAKDGDNRSVSVRHYPGEYVENVVNVNGAGDSLASGIIAGFLESLPEENCISVGLAAARTALNSSSAIPECFFKRDDQCWTAKPVYHNL